MALRSAPRSAARRRSFPVTVTRLPTVRCAQCGRTLSHRPGEASKVLTTHYQQAHMGVVTR